MKHVIIILYTILIGTFLPNSKMKIVEERGAQGYIFQGNNAYRNERYEIAIEQYLNAIFLGYNVDKDFSLNFKLGRSYFENGKFDESLVYFQKTKQFTTSVDDYIDLFIAKNFTKKGQLYKAIDILESTLANHPNTKLTEEIQILLATLYQQTGKWGKANQYWQILGNKKSNKSRRPEFWIKVAENYLRLGNDKKAIEYLCLPLQSDKYRKHERALSSFYRLASYKDSLRMNLTETELLDGIATLIIHKKFDKALRWVNYFFKTYSDTFNEGAIYYRLGKLFYKQRTYYSAILNFQRVINRFPESRYTSSAQYYIARSRYNQGQINKCIEEYLKYYRNYPDASRSAFVLWQVGWLYEYRNENLRAAEVYQELYRNYPTSKYRIKAKWRRGYCFYKSAEYDRARAVFQYIQENTTVSEEMHDRCTFWIAKCYERKGEIGKAKTIYKTLVDHPENNYYRALCYRKWGDKQISKPHIQLARTQESISVSRAKIENTKLQKVLTIYDLIGESHARKELRGFLNKYAENGKKIKQMSWVCEQLGLYGDAFRAGLKLSNMLSDSTDKQSMLVYRYPTYYSEFVKSFSRTNKVDPYLIFGMIRQESAFEGGAKSWVGAKGVMQIMPKTGRELAVKMNINKFTLDDLDDPELNILMGTKYLSDDLQRFQGRIELAVAAYNAGFDAVQRWIEWFGTGSMDEFVENITYTETRNYVKRVMRNYWIYEMLYKNGTPDLYKTELETP